MATRARPRQQIGFGLDGPQAFIGRRYQSFLGRLPRGLKFLGVDQLFPVPSLSTRASVAACVAVVIAVLTGFGIEAKGIRFVPNEAVPRVARLEECTR